MGEMGARDPPSEIGDRHSAPPAPPRGLGLGQERDRCPPAPLEKGPWMGAGVTAALGIGQQFPSRLGMGSGVLGQDTPLK